MNYIQMQELAGTALGKTEAEVRVLLDDPEELDNAIYNKFGIDFEQFCLVAEALLPLTPMVELSISKECVHAFVRHGDKHRTILVQMPHK